MVGLVERKKRPSATKKRSPGRLNIGLSSVDVRGHGLDPNDLGPKIDLRNA